MILTAQRQGLFFEIVSFFDDLLFFSKIYISRGDIVQRFMESLVVVICHPVGDGLLKFFGRVVVLQFDHILHGPMPALDLSLGHRMIRSAVDMLHPPLGQEASQIFGMIG